MGPLRCAQAGSRLTQGQVKVRSFQQTMARPEPFTGRHVLAAANPGDRMVITRLSMMTLMLALVACSEAESPAAPVSPSSTPVADSSSPCQAAQLTLALESADAGAGNRGHTLAVTNTGNAACTMEGWPEMRLLDAE